jgi:hypothetical protein
MWILLLLSTFLTLAWAQPTPRLPVVITVTCSTGCKTYGWFDVTFDGGPVLPSPTLTLTRGALYLFEINAPGQPVAIHFAPGQISTTYRYNTGVINNGLALGTIVFQVPNDAPSVLYYQGEAGFPLFGRLDIVGGTASPIPTAAPTPVPTTAPETPRYWTPTCSDGIETGGSGGSIGGGGGGGDGPRPASPESNPTRRRRLRARRNQDEDDDDDDEYAGLRHRRGLATRATVGNGYSCSTSTRAEHLMDLCTFFVARESVSPSETCLSSGPGLFTPVSSARLLMACGVVQFNAWSAFDGASQPLKVDTWGGGDVGGGDDDGGWRMMNDE